MNIKNKLNEYINNNLNSFNQVLGSASLFEKAVSKRSAKYEECCCDEEIDIDNYININKDNNTFQIKLFEYIDNKGLKDSDVYNKVNIDRRLFSKIRSNKDYHPSKETIILLGISLELAEEEIEELLASASYSLPKNTVFDLIIRFCFKEKIYDLNQINEFLYDHNCKLLNQ